MTKRIHPAQTARTITGAAAGLALAAYLGITATMLSTAAAPGAWFSFFLCGVVGICAAYSLISGAGIRVVPKQLSADEFVGYDEERVLPEGLAGFGLVRFAGGPFGPPAEPACFPATAL